MKLSRDKCCIPHVVTIEGKCFNLKVHGEVMHQVGSTKYLGDIIHKSGKLSAILADRHAKAVDSLSVIRAKHSAWKIQNLYRI